MDKRRFSLLAFLCLMMIFSLSATPAYAGVHPEKLCSGADYYIYNAIDTEIYIDLANWTIHDHMAMAYLDLGESVHLRGAPGGWIEFYVDLMDIPYQLGDWRYVEECSKIAYYIKLVNGEPVLKVKYVPSSE